MQRDIVITKKSAFIKQIAFYLNSSDYQQAYSLSKEFASMFPSEMISHYFLAKSAYWADQLEEARLESRKAFNMTTNQEDMCACAVLSSTVYYRLGEYSKGYEILRTASKAGCTEEMEQLMFLFSLALQDANQAMAHIAELHRMNRGVAEDFMARFLKSRARGAR